jgi:hypothetical protein
MQQGCNKVQPSGVSRVRAGARERRVVGVVEVGAARHLTRCFRTAPRTVLF